MLQDLCAAVQEQTLYCSEHQIRTERELLPCMVGNSLALPYIVMGNPTGHGIQFQCMEILFNYLCQRSALVLQSITPSDLYEQLGFPLYLNGTGGRSLGQCITSKYGWLNWFLHGNKLATIGHQYVQPPFGRFSPILKQCDILKGLKPSV